MIRLRQAAKYFGAVRAVDGVTLEVQPGEIFGLVGPDGAGKTTLIRLLTGVLTPGAGEIEVLGRRNLEDIKEHIGYIPQKFSLYGDMTVIENIRLLGSLYGADAAAIAARAREILAFTNLLPFQDRLADRLSGGMKQKLALAAGLMHRPKLFFLDEPTTGVDPVSRREFWQMLYRMNQDGMTVLVSTPYMDEAELCHRVAFMHQGRIVACGSPLRLRRSYPHRILELETSAKHINRHLAGVPIRDMNAFGDKYHLVVDDPETAMAAIRQALAAAGLDIGSLRETAPSLEDVFVELAGEE
ncbi:ATP-binding cassette domain-containing protein [Acetonema longum]|uniref:ABC transporter related protein n=1 Tax=Acetonema longum DSM 6540 TaxID=1009370 RepID=F7NP10_9FIRM|nr:ABC transporter ATP-binding protein [Acetonema longum]EGO62133.1 ABC transporter related protein [Acetonema longum DSM 6540]